MQHAMMNVRVAAKRLEAEDIVSLELVSMDGSELPPFSAGSHIDVEVTAGIVRQYSLCNCPNDRHRYLIAVLKEPLSRGGSVGMHKNINEGDIIRISEPKNLFPLKHEAGKSLLFAGGIGITPILCMAERLAVTGADFELNYFCRSKSRAAFHNHIQSSSYADKVHFHFEDAKNQGATSMSDVLAVFKAEDHLYVCGPSGFIQFILDNAREQGWSESNLHREYFIPPAAEQSESSDTFGVKIASTGKVLEVSDDRSVADVLGEAGIEIAMSCEQGVCGTCLTRVLEGTPDHRDFFMTDQEHSQNDQFTPCCSRSKSPLLVLDL